MILLLSFLSLCISSMLLSLLLLTKEDSSFPLVSNLRLFFLHHSLFVGEKLIPLEITGRSEEILFSHPYPFLSAHQHDFETFDALQTTKSPRFYGRRRATKKRGCHDHLIIFWSMFNVQCIPSSSPFLLKEKNTMNSFSENCNKSAHQMFSQSKVIIRQTYKEIFSLSVFKDYFCLLHLMRDQLISRHLKCI